jgi:MarR family transcriptional regulator, organic hydroperoxide resistance regulator
MHYKPGYESVNFLLAMICRAQRTQMNEALTAIGLYAGQEMFLWHLWREDGLTQSQIVERMCVQPPTVSKMLERMEKAGWVTHRPDPEDSRVSRVCLTEQGRRSEQAVRDVWKQAEKRITEGLSVEERVLLRRLLLHVHAQMTRNP